jgi:putative ABC transport system ATP-binding protein
VTVPRPAGGPVVRFDAVGRTFDGPLPVTALHPCDLVIEPGQQVAVVGPSGSGKSTLLNLMGLLDRPTTGRYELNGVDVCGLREKERTALRAYSIGFVFQEFHLLSHRSAVDNVALGQLYAGVSHARRYAAAKNALVRVGLGDRMTALPTTMSGGERQRIAVARALVHRPALLLCDEPTGNLDSVTAAGVLDLLGELNADGLTVLIITHDTTVAARADRTVAIRDGRVGEGTDAQAVPLRMA